MNYNICSISFRHELVSFHDLAGYAHSNGFNGIELWGVHAEALACGQKTQTIRVLEELGSHGLGVSMISHYVPLLVPEALEHDLLAQWSRLIALAKLFGTDKIRIFAGDLSSNEASAAQRSLCVFRLRQLSDIAYEAGVNTLVEFHPRTLFDTLPSAVSLLQETDHPGLRVNFDVLHVWESGSDPVYALSVLKPWVSYFHLKNVTDRAHLTLFHPGNVYSPSGDRNGLASLSEGAVDYVPIIHHLLRESPEIPASLEWFGGQPADRLRSELLWLRQLEQEKIVTG